MFPTINSQPFAYTSLDGGSLTIKAEEGAVLDGGGLTEVLRLSRTVGRLDNHALFTLSNVTIKNSHSSGSTNGVAGLALYGASTFIYGGR